MKRYTVYMPDEDGERVDALKERMNVSEIARTAILREAARLEGEGATEASESLVATVAERIKASGVFERQKEEAAARRADHRAKAVSIGALFAEELVERGQIDYSVASELSRTGPGDHSAALYARLIGQFGTDGAGQWFPTATRVFMETLEAALAD